MSIAINTRIKALALKSIIEQLAGGSCILEERESSIKIILTESQKRWIQDFIDKQLNMKIKPDIEIDVLGVILPVIFKHAWPFLAAGGAGIAALVFGRKKDVD